MTPNHMRTELIIESARQFARGKTSVAPVVRAVRLSMKEGCGSHSCEFRRPTGQGTNSMCRCFDLIGTALEVVKDAIEATT